jgi:hypothetical protein
MSDSLQDALFATFCVACLMTVLTLEARNSYQEISEIGIRISLEERKWECGLSDGVTTHSIGRDLGNPIAAGMRIIISLATERWPFG